ncbi:MAG: alpha/beta hydrolase [Candidatus Pacebacteria bacterium]|nr:alpha/beta hydrolase [Candidatus Paceibacterota bacterium]MCF7857362.1 alpha/beta hydrolase [Candidatus Paceibacterota bacterium]
MNIEKKQIVFIHGGNAYSEYKNFLEWLRVKEIEDPLEEGVFKKWQPTLRTSLSQSYDVYYPAMPNSKNAKYEEWKIWFERHHAFLRDGVTLIGHSLGGYFLAKYLSEEKMPVSVHALYFLAAPFENDDFGGEDGGDFAFDSQNLHRLALQVDGVYIFHSKDDSVVPYTHALKYAEALPGAELVSFEDKNHFLHEKFPEIIEHIQKH